MKANLKDLAAVLFEQIERLNDDELHGDDLEEQLKKSKAIGATAATIVKIADVTLTAAKVSGDGFVEDASQIKLITG